MCPYVVICNKILISFWEDGLTVAVLQSGQWEDLVEYSDKELGVGYEWEKLMV